MTQTNQSFFRHSPLLCVYFVVCLLFSCDDAVYCVSFSLCIVCVGALFLLRLFAVRSLGCPFPLGAALVAVAARQQIRGLIGRRGLHDGALAELGLHVHAIGALGVDFSF